MVAFMRTIRVQKHDARRLIAELADLKTSQVTDMLQSNLPTEDRGRQV